MIIMMKRLRNTGVKTTTLGLPLTVGANDNNDDGMG